MSKTEIRALGFQQASKMNYASIIVTVVCPLILLAGVMIMNYGG